MIPFEYSKMHRIIFNILLHNVQLNVESEGQQIMSAEIKGNRSP